VQHLNVTIWDIIAFEVIIYKCLLYIILDSPLSVSQRFGSWTSSLLTFDFR